MKSKKEFSIMPECPYYSTTRFYGSERHEVFEGRTGNREKSIRDGLVIFITPYDHRISRESVHLDPKNSKWIEVKRLAQKAWQEHYNKTKEDFIKEYGRNYLDN